MRTSSIFRSILPVQPYCNAYLSLLAAMDVEPDDVDKVIQNTLIEGFVDGGWLTRMDCALMYGLHNEQASLLWLNNPTRNAVAYNGIVHTPFGYFEGDGITRFVNTTFVPSVDASHYSLNEATHIYIVLENVSELKYDGGVYDGTVTSGFVSRNTHSPNNIGAVYTNYQSGYSTVCEFNCIDSIGIWYAVRNSNVQEQAYKNESSITTKTSNVGTQIPTKTMFTHARNNNDTGPQLPCTKKIGGFFVMDKVTLTDVQGISLLIKNYYANYGITIY